AAPVTLGNSNQWPSPSALIMWPSYLAAWRAKKSRCSPRSACRSADSSSRKRDVEPLMSVFTTTVVRSEFIVHYRSWPALVCISASAKLLRDSLSASPLGLHHIQRKCKTRAYLRRIAVKDDRTALA